MKNFRRDPRPAARWWKRPVALVGASVATVGVAWAAYDAALKPAPLAELIPEYVPGFGVVDARQAWDLAADVRNTKHAREMLAEAEKELRVNIETDVLPWAGQVAVAPLGMPAAGQGPPLAVLVEVRNPAQYYLTMTRLRTRLEREATPHWKGTGYHGVPLRYGYVGRGADRTPVSTAWLKGWVVVGVGNGSAKRVIDAWQGRKRTLSNNTAWAAAMAGVPAGGPVRLGVNLGAVETKPLPGLPRELTEMGRSVLVESLHDTGDGVRLDFAAVPTSDSARKVARELARTAAPPETGLLDRAPEGTFAVAAFGDAPGIWNLYMSVFARVMASQSVSRAEAEKVMKPATDIISRLRGGLAFGAVAGEENGGAVFALGDFGDEDAARAGAEELADFAEKHGAKVEVGAGDSSYAISMPSTAQPGVTTVAPGWSVDGRYLLAASNKAWLTAPPAAAPEPLPEEARDAPFVARGNFGFVPVLMRYMQSVSGGEEGEPLKKRMAGWKATRLEDAHWTAWTHYQADGSSTGAVDLANWPWREALRSAVAGK